MKLEFTKYIPSPDDDMLMAMLLNPPIAQLGFEWLMQADKDFTKASVENIIKIFVEFLVNVYKDNFLAQLIEEDEKWNNKKYRLLKVGVSVL